MFQLRGAYSLMTKRFWRLWATTVWNAWSLDANLSRLLQTDSCFPERFGEWGLGFRDLGFWDVLGLGFKGSGFRGLGGLGLGDWGLGSPAAHNQSDPAADNRTVPGPRTKSETVRPCVT